MPIEECHCTTSGHDIQAVSVDCPYHGPELAQISKGASEDGSVGFDCEHKGRRALVTFASDGDVEILITRVSPAPGLPVPPIGDAPRDYWLDTREWKEKASTGSIPVECPAATAVGVDPTASADRAGAAEAPVGKSSRGESRVSSDGSGPIAHEEDSRSFHSALLRPACGDRDAPSRGREHRAPPLASGGPLMSLESDHDYVPQHRNRVTEADLKKLRQAEHRHALALRRSPRCRVHLHDRQTVPAPIVGHHEDVAEHSPLALRDARRTASSPLVSPHRRRTRRPGRAARDVQAPGSVRVPARS